MKGVDLNKTIKNRPDNGAQIGGRGGVSGGSAKSPNFTFFFEAFPKEIIKGEGMGAAIKLRGIFLMILQI